MRILLPFLSFALLACDPADEVSLRDAPEGCYYGPVDDSFVVSACVIHTTMCLSGLADEAVWCDDHEAECFEAMLGCVNSGMECAKQNLSD